MNPGDFMKTNLFLAFKLFLFLIFADFAALMIAISFFVIFHSVPWAAYTFSQLFSVIVLIVVIWQSTYMLGFKDCNMVRTGHSKEDICRGFKIGALAQIPGVLFFILSVAFNLRFSLYRLANSFYWTFLTALTGSFNDKWLAEVLMRKTGVLSLTGMALMLLIIPAISGTVYIFGYRGVDFFTKLVYKKRKEK